MAADVHVRLKEVLQLAAPAVAGWRVLLPFWSVLTVCFVWFWLPKLVVWSLTRLSRRYVKQTSTGHETFVKHRHGEHSMRSTMTK